MFIDGKSEIDLHVFCGRDFSCNQINFLRRLSNKKGTMKIPNVNRRSSSKAQLKYDHISLRDHISVQRIELFQRKIENAHRKLPQNCLSEIKYYRHWVNCFINQLDDI